MHLARVFGRTYSGAMNLHFRRRSGGGLIFVAGVTLVTLLMACSLLLAKPGVVKTKTGRTYYGDVTTAPDGTVVVTIHGVEKRIPQAEIESVSDQPGDFSADFDARKKQLDPKDVAGRIELAKFALDNGEYMLANNTIEEAVKLDPKNAEANSLRDTIRREARADRQRTMGGGHGRPATTQSGGGTGAGAGSGSGSGSGATAPPGAGAEHPMPPPPATPPQTPPQTPETPADNGGAAPGGEEKPAPTAPLAPGERHLLTADDIQRIRRMELKRGDTARIQIPQDVKRNFVAQNGLSFPQFNAKPPVEQALQIFEKGTDEMREKVHVLSDPESLTQFKSLQRNIVQGCATNNCHGPQAAAGGFVLFPPDSDPATYTNFYILTHTSKKVGQNTGGPFGGPSEREMIERGSGKDSLLAQYGLPSGKSEHPHPKAGNYRGIYSGPDDARYRKLIDWMNNVLKPVPPEPDYQIDYPMPGGGGHGTHRNATTRQATMPSTQNG